MSSPKWRLHVQDDNFGSIVKTVLWGRSVFANLRKFLQFQLTVNGVARVIAFVAAVTNGDTPLNVLELLWVNLIMDAMAALGDSPLSPRPFSTPPLPHVIRYKTSGLSHEAIDICWDDITSAKALSSG